MSRLDALREKFRGVSAERLAHVRAGQNVEHELHTLKGEAHLLGFEHVARVTAALETLASLDPRPDAWMKGLELVERLAGEAPDHGEDEASAFLSSLDP